MWRGLDERLGVHVCVCVRDMREVVNIATIDRRPTLRALDPTPTISPVVPIQRAVT